MANSRALRAGLAAALVLCVAGCGGSQFASGANAAPRLRPTAPPTTRPAPVHRPALRAALVRSASTTRAAHTARTSVSVTVTGLGEDVFATGAFDVAGTGAVDLGTGDADLVLSIPLFDQLGGGGAIEERIVKGVAYARLPGSVLRAGGLPPAVRWLRVDGAPSRGASASTLSQSQVDPAGELAFLSAASDDVRPIAVEEVRGIRTTHYSATVVQETGARAGSKSELAGRLGDVGARLGPGPVGIDVWIDGAGLARRIVVSLPLADAGLPVTAGVVPAMRIQADFYAFGVPVRVVAPPRPQVRAFSALRLPSLGG